MGFPVYSLSSVDSKWLTKTQFEIISSLMGYGLISNKITSDKA